LNIAIIGGGISGLSTGHFLSKQGHKVTVFERDDALGGLASSFDFGKDADDDEKAGITFIERYYHFICGGDDDLIDLCDELGLGNKLNWRDSNMSFYHDGRLYPFSTPLNLLMFSPVSLVGRIRFGLHILYSKLIKSWQKLEGESAEAWLTRHIGRQAFDVIWKPLLKIKFGEYADEVAASWMWHRIHRVAESRKNFMAREQLGFLAGGTKMVLDALAEKIEKSGGDVRTSTGVSSIIVKGGRATGVMCGGETLEFDAVVSTVAPPLLCRMLPDECSDYTASLARIKYIGVVCMILKLSRSITKSFWVNVNDPRIAFNGIIEYTNLNPRPDLNGSKIAYIPYYLKTTNERYSYSDQQLLEEYSAALGLVSPEFSPSWIQGWRVFRDPYAQAICGTNFSEMVPDQKTPVDGLYMIDSAQLYPSDRTISGMIGLGKTLAEAIGTE
jgi:protoporphyrinogen oxidase